MRERAQHAGCEQTLDEIGTPPSWLRLSDEHLRVCGTSLRLREIDWIDVYSGPPVAVCVVSGGARWSVELQDCSPVAAARFVQRARDAMLVVDDVHAVYAARRAAELSEMSAVLAERQAEREAWAARTRQLELDLERDLELDASRDAGSTTCVG